MTKLNALTESQRAELQKATDDAFVVRGALPGLGQDHYPLIAAQVAACKAAGGGTVVVEHIGYGGYSISDCIVVDFDNCTILLDDDVTLTKTTAKSFVGPDASAATGVHGVSMCAFLFAGKLIGSGKYYLKRPQLIGLRKVMIDGNGRNCTDYGTYVVGSAGNHHVVGFMGVDDAVCRNVYAYNGLTGGITQAYGHGTLFEDCDASHSVYDNGLLIGANSEHFLTFSDTNPRTWNNGRIVNCKAWMCANHAGGAYGAVGVTLENFKYWGCGNNTGAAVSGPAGGINVEHDGVNVTRDYRFVAINCEGDGSYGFPFRTNCRGTRLIGGRFTGTKKPTNYTDAAIPLWGNAIFVQGGATLDAIGVVIDGADAYGIRANTANGLFPSVRFGGRIENCALGSIYAFGIALLKTDLSCEFNNNGSVGQTDGTKYSITVSNAGSTAASNQDLGVVDIAGSFNENHGPIATVSRIGTFNVNRGINGHNNAKSSTSSVVMITADDITQRLRVANIMITSDQNDGTSKVGRIMRVGQVSASAVVDLPSVLGYQINTSVNNVSFTTTPSHFNYHSHRYLEAAAPTLAPVFVGQEWATTAGVFYKAKGKSAVGDWMQLN